jgi:hypothetical protein
LCAFILIEGFKLEDLLQEDEEAKKHTLLHHRAMDGLQSELSSWGALPQHASVLLAWATVLCRAEQLQLSDFEYQQHAQRAYALSVFEQLNTVMDQSWANDGVCIVRVWGVRLAPVEFQREKEK